MKADVLMVLLWHYYRKSGLLVLPPPHPQKTARSMEAFHCSASLIPFVAVPRLCACSLVDINTFQHPLKITGVSTWPTNVRSIKASSCCRSLDEILNSSSHARRVPRTSHWNQSQQCHTPIELHFFQKLYFSLKDLKCNIWNEFLVPVWTYEPWHLRRLFLSKDRVPFGKPPTAPSISDYCVIVQTSTFYVTSLATEWYWRKLSKVL